MKKIIFFLILFLSGVVVAERTVKFVGNWLAVRALSSGYTKQQVSNATEAQVRKQLSVYEPMPKFDTWWKDNLVAVKTEALKRMDEIPAEQKIASDSVLISSDTTPKGKTYSIAKIKAWILENEPNAILTVIEPGLYQIDVRGGK